MLTFNLSIFSKYRTELMGIAALMIIICHSPKFIVMPGWLHTILGNGGTGCDVFLFLSGFGICNSYSNNLAKGKSLISWYWKRYIRIIVPCAFFIIGLWLYRRNYANTDWLAFAIDLSGFYYLTGHLALWYVACALLLYIITPIIHVPLIGEKRWSWLGVLCFLSLLFWYVDLGSGDIIHNWQFCVARFPSYFIGYVLAKDIKESKNASLVCMVAIPLLLYTVFFILNHTVGTNFSLFWTQGIPIVTICALVLDRIQFKIFHAILFFVGGVSLESYATNILVLPNLQFLSFEIFGVNINPYNLTFYFVGTIICLGLSILVNRISKIIIMRIS